MTRVRDCVHTVGSGIDLVDKEQRRNGLLISARGRSDPPLRGRLILTISIQTTKSKAENFHRFQGVGGYDDHV